jgi:hypothetical protein
MTALIFHVLAWPTLGVALVVFGFAPGAVLRMIVLFYSRDHPRRRELLGELYGVPRIERPFWVAEQLEVAVFEGLGSRIKRLFGTSSSRPLCMHCGIILEVKAHRVARLRSSELLICPNCSARNLVLKPPPRWARM